VNEATLCEMTGFKTAELLLTKVDKHGSDQQVLQDFFHVTVSRRLRFFIENLEKMVLY